ncbi:ATP-dependent DNA helicase RecQ [Bengtsoniella intestinalis]|uniref:RecQ family ATP-dependent DNA helicase n=1 Tax=Bengtsoniella intestinalis TaxID=3073143 RepID=UPI00391FA40C
MEPLSLLKHHFGYQSFRGGQEALIHSILQGQDALGIMPTGAGKSICYQVPALAMEGIALVVSPLISLMQDQVVALKQAGVPAAYFNSTLTPKQRDLALYRASLGQYKLIYVAPERLLTPNFLAFAQSAPITMVAVDEAHCISQWGQDFRPSYGQIPQFIASLPKRPVVCAFTATATQKVTDDIKQLLDLQQPKVLITGFDRENLYFEVQQPKKKMEALLRFLKQKSDQSGIIYCSTRKAVEEVCQQLNDQRYYATRYHAGLSDEERRRNQEAFLFDQIPLMVATNAFGMGIDKSNVSFVVHYNMPKDLESYYQEAGRAGRDGAPAHCLLLYSGQDVRTNQWLIENGRDVEAADPETAQMLINRDKERLKQMTFFATTERCLRNFILRYFGEHPSQDCGHCSTCVLGARQVEAETGWSKRPTSTKRNYEHSPLNSQEQQLLLCLQRLRKHLADQQGVPPFMIFGDATMQAMCRLKPANKSEFLEVPGVGDVKLQRYGEAFLLEIKDFVRRTYDGVPPPPPTPVAMGAPKKAKEQLPLPTPAILDSLPISQEPTHVSALTMTINGVLKEGGYMGVSSYKIFKWLMSQGYLMEQETPEGKRKVPTQKGIYAGIVVEERQGADKTYSVNLYPPELQREIIAHLTAIIQG